MGCGAYAGKMGSEEEIDSSAHRVRLKDGQWAEPQQLSKDSWEIQGRPVNGPAISSAGRNIAVAWFAAARDQPKDYAAPSAEGGVTLDRKSTRLNSSHLGISYAVFC